MSYRILDTTLDKFLGTFAGTPAEIDHEGINGLCRVFKDKHSGFSTLGATWVDLRTELQSQDSGTQYASVGNKFHRIGSVYFKTLKTFTYTPDESGRTAHTNCFGYALSTFGAKLEDIALKPMKEIISDVSGSIDDSIKAYFVPVHDKPQDGDLAVYYPLYDMNYRGHIIRTEVATHAGIYREVPDFSTGVVESKWGWLSNPYVFQHSVFFTPEFYGDQVVFYRLAEENTPEYLGADAGNLIMDLPL